MHNSVLDIFEVGLINLAEVGVNRFDVVIQAKSLSFKIIAASYHLVSDTFFDNLFLHKVRVGVFLHLGGEDALLLNHELDIAKIIPPVPDILPDGVLICQMLLSFSQGL